MQKAKVEFVPTRSFAVVIGDYEQEAEVILTIWVLAFMGYKARRVIREREMLDRRLLEIPDGTSILPQDAREYSRALEALPQAEQDYLLPRTLLSALQRFATTGSIQRVKRAVVIRAISMSIFFEKPPPRNPPRSGSSRADDAARFPKAS